MTLLDYFIIHKRKLHCNSFMLIFCGFFASFPPVFDDLPTPYLKSLCLFPGCYGWRMLNRGVGAAFCAIIYTLK